MLSPSSSSSQESKQGSFPTMHQLATSMRVEQGIMMDVGREALRHMMWRKTPVQVVGTNGPIEMQVMRKGLGPLKTDFGPFWHARFNTGDEWGDYHALIAAESIDEKTGMPHFANEQELLVRTDSGCITGQVFHDITCDCRQQLHQAMTQVTERGEGMIIHIPGQDGRGMGLDFKLGTMFIQEKLKANTVQAACILSFMREMQQSVMILCNLAEFEAAQDVINKAMNLEGEAEALWDAGETTRAMDMLNDAQAEIVTIVQKTHEKLHIADIDQRNYEGVIGVLKALGIEPTTTIDMATNNPHKMEVFTRNGYKISNTPVIASNASAIAHHLHAKAAHLGHQIPSNVGNGQ